MVISEIHILTLRYLLYSNRGIGNSISFRGDKVSRGRINPPRSKSSGRMISLGGYSNTVDI